MRPTRQPRTAGVWSHKKKKIPLISAQLDHFNAETGKKTFKQKYLVYDANYKSGGAIFFYCGNEGPIGEFYNNTGFPFDIAPEFNAVVIFAEVRAISAHEFTSLAKYPARAYLGVPYSPRLQHRYYGESMPFGKDSFSLYNIGYLSIEQALADYAELLLALKPKYNEAPVITFGGSYGGALHAARMGCAMADACAGMLSGWMREKYPFIVDMALAASAPYKVASLQVAPGAVFQSITNTFATANPACPDLIRRGFSQLIETAATGSAGLAELTSVFKLCAPLTQERVHHLILWAVNAFPTLGMCDYPYPCVPAVL